MCFEHVRNKHCPFTAYTADCFPPSDKVKPSLTVHIAQDPYVWMCAKALGFHLDNYVM